MKICLQRVGPLFLLCCFLAAPHARSQSGTPEVTRGPFYSGTIRGKGANQTIAMKGLVVTVGAAKNAYVCYDADLLRVSLAWTGEFLEFGNTQYQITWPPPPQVKGSPLFETPEGPGWAKGGSFEDPRPGQQGPLPKDWAHYKGLYVQGDRVVLQYSVGAATVLESPSFDEAGGQKLFSRTIQFSDSAEEVVLLVAGNLSQTTLATDFDGNSGPSVVRLSDGSSLAVAGQDLPKGARLETDGQGRLLLKLPKVAAHRPFRLVLSDDGAPAGFVTTRESKLPDLRHWTQGGPAQWTQPVVTQGQRAADEEAYVVDTLTEPVDNPYHAKTFFGGFDFFPDGRAALCTFHGDVWIVSGIDDSLSNLTWKRHATGLFQALGLKIVDGNIYVLGRDQITRLKDLNGDGEADFYENFNNDTVVTPNYHEFSLDLHTDRAGNFYFAKGAPWEPSVTSPHQGCLFKVSKDGSKLEVFATGLRAPNGMAVGPRDEVTVSDNQGHWMPASKLNWVEKGGFYGMIPAAQREIQFERDGARFTANPSLAEDRARFQFKGWDDKALVAAGYDEPLCWLPMGMDNSSGGQVWATTDRWGPLNGHLLFMSYGKCTLFDVLLDEVEGVRQAAMVQLPLKFYTGVMRGRVNPRDGQVYLCGLKGWQSSATRDGGFYRVRHTGKPHRYPVGFRALATGLELTFAVPLEPKIAADPANYSVDRWNYQWTGSYGSGEFSVKDPSVRRHDRLEITGARVSPDGKTVRLRISGMLPCDQIRVRYSIDSADGEFLSHELHGTIRKLRPAPADD